MATTQPIAEDATVGTRLRDATAFDPRRAPRLDAMLEGWGEALARRLRDAAGAPLTVAVAPASRRSPLTAAEPDAAARHYAAIRISDQRAPGFAIFEDAGLDALYAMFFGAEPAGGDRAVTALDRELIKLVAMRAMQAAAEAFASMMTLSADCGAPGRIDALDLPEDDEAAAETRAASLVVMPATITARDLSATVALALPVALFSPHRKALGVKSDETAAPDPDEGWRRAIQANFAASDIEMQAVLAQWSLPLAKLATFRPGQTLALPTGPDDPVTVACEDHPLFRARIGRSGSSYVLRVTERIDPSEEFIHGILSD